ncbi:MAG: hypothetical protein IKO93_11560 [Lentisphaeria bacterium]|nr:hypothetical protein [Lentisphaeria bacterium]
MACHKFRGKLSPFHAVREKNKIIVSNEFVRCVHDLDQGGEMTEAVILNGSGKNLFVKAQNTVIGITQNSLYHLYSSSAAPAVDFSVTKKGGNPVLQFSSAMADDSGKTLPGFTLHHRVEYTPQGEALHRLTFSASQKITGLGMVQIGSLYPVKRMDTLAIMPSQVEMSMPYVSRCRWHKLAGDATAAYMTRWVPNAMLVFQRGVEGFQFVRGDDLENWESIGGTLPGFGMGYFSYVKGLDAYEMRFAPLDCRREGQYLEGEYTFEFSLAFPYVRKNIVPLSPCSGNLLRKTGVFEKRWPTEEDFTSWEKAGVSLMRLHNDGDPFGNGIFWRDAAYPPYPPEEMKKMEQTLELAHRHHIDVVPYFSLHEYHPEAPGFRQNAQEWCRIAEKGDSIIPSYSRNGYYGFVMCLASGWMEKRKNTIDQVLRNHAFNGVYYDWCTAMECVNPEHGPHHWDFRKLIQLLLWTYQRIGPDGDMYLHLTHNPNIAAENLAGLVLTEETGVSRFSGEMFSPHAHFMNICPRQVCLMISEKSSVEDLIRYAMCALLNHATVSSGNMVLAEFYRKHAGMMKKTGRYCHHSAPGERLCKTSDGNAVGMSAYWNKDEAMLVFANLMDHPKTVEYCFAPETKTPLTGNISLKPLSIRTVTRKLR